MSAAVMTPAAVPEPTAVTAGMAIPPEYAAQLARRAASQATGHALRCVWGGGPIGPDQPPGALLCGAHMRRPGGQLCE